jgi:hypothetical protein
MAQNGQIIATSETYPDKKSALKGIASIVKNAPTAKIVDDTGDDIAVKKAVKGKAAKSDETTAPKAPRGRKKTVEATTEAVKKSAKEIDTPKKRGRKPVQSPAEESTAFETLEMVETPKKRGRKPKVTE